MFFYFTQPFYTLYEIFFNKNCAFEKITLQEIGCIDFFFLKYNYLLQQQPLVFVLSSRLLFFLVSPSSFFSNRYMMLGQGDLVVCSGGSC